MMPIQDEQTDAGDELSRSKGTKQALEEQITGLKSDLDAVQTGEDRLAKLWRAAIARIAQILVLNGQVAAEDRVTDKMIAEYFVERDLLVKTDGRGPNGREINRHMSLAKWAMPEKLASEEEQTTLRYGIEIDGRVYHTSLDALEDSGLGWSGVYEIMAAHMREAHGRSVGRGGPRNVLPSKVVATNPNEVGAVDRFLERAKFRRTVQPSRDNPRGIERVLLKENQAAAFGMMLGLARRFVWSGEQRGQIVAAMQEKKAGAGEAGEKVAAKDAA